MRNSPSALALSLMRLYRLDAAIISYLSLIFGAFLANVDFSLETCIMGFYVSWISVNFVYSVNSIADRSIDSINKPNRPMASGALDVKWALGYVVLLFVFSLVPVFWGSSNLIETGAWLAIPILGVLYSNPVFPFKKIPVLASLTTAAILVLPMVIGYCHYSSVRSSYWSIALIFLFCLFTVPLKDIEDKKGDLVHGSGNWYAILNDWILLVPILGYFVIAILAFMLGLHRNIILITSILLASTTFLVVLAKLKVIRMELLYRAIILTVIIVGSGLLIAYSLFGFGL